MIAVMTYITADTIWYVSCHVDWKNDCGKESLYEGG